MTPTLQPPGAGLPWWELLLARHVLLPLTGRKLDWPRAGALFQKEGRKVLALFDALPADRRTERVLIPRLRGMEDSSRHWSAAMTVEHLNIVGRAFLDVIASLRAGNVPPGKASTADVKPRGEETAAETRAKFVQLLADSAEADQLPPMLPGVGPRYVHPWFGPMEAHRWHALNGIHQNIHRQQLEAIRDGLRLDGSRNLQTMRARHLFGLSLLLLLAAMPSVVVRGQELVVSREGQVLRNARIEHVDPDGITYRHNAGDTKLAFEDLPESVRRAYGYDPKRAADFRRQQVEKAEADRRTVAESEARHREALAKRAAELAAVATATAETGFTYAPGAGATGADAATTRAAAASVAAQMERWERVRARLNDHSPLNNPLLEKSPIGSVQNILDRRPGEFGNGESSFFTPNYEKRQFADLYEKPPGR